MKFGVIGAGAYARYRVLPSFARSSSAVLQAVQRRSSDELNELAAAFSVPQKFTSIDDLLRCDVDAVWVCSPNKLHFEHSKKVIASGRHLLVEKPVALNEQDARQLADLAQKAGVFAGAGYCCRYSPAAAAAKTRIADLGELVHASGFLSINRQEPGNARYQSWMLEDEGSGTGVLFDLGCHLLDLLLFLTGDDWQVTYAGSTAYTPGGSSRTDASSDTATLQLSGAGGRRSASLFASHRSSRCSQLALIGTQGTMLLSLPFGKDALQALTFIKPNQACETSFFADADVQRDFLDAFVSACRGSDGRFPTLEQSVPVQRWIDQARRVRNAK